jgi:cytochrome c553
MKSVQRRAMISVLTVLTVVATGQGQSPVAPKPVAAAAAAVPAPLWAFPGPLNKTVPGSSKAFSDVQMFDRTTAVDWFPDSHPVMPESVKGRFPVYACGFCHLPQGLGRPENAALAGLPYEYFTQQVADMRSGKRKLVESTFGPGTNMMLTINHKQLSKQDTDEAAKYYASLKYKKFTKIIETTEIPRVTTNSFVYVFDKSGAREPLGERIVEGPDDFEAFEHRDPNSTFTAYVPVGSISRGAQLVKGNGSTRLPCESCHGVGLKGGPLGPPVAGRPVTAIFRQFYAFQNGTRNGATAILMKPIVDGLSYSQMIDIAAYVGSLEP